MFHSLANTSLAQRFVDLIFAFLATSVKIESKKRIYFAIIADVIKQAANPSQQTASRLSRVLHLSGAEATLVFPERVQTWMNSRRDKDPSGVYLDEEIEVQQAASFFVQECPLWLHYASSEQMQKDVAVLLRKITDVAVEPLPQHASRT